MLYLNGQYVKKYKRISEVNISDFIVKSGIFFLICTVYIEIKKYSSVILDQWKSPCKIDFEHNF